MISVVKVKVRMTLPPPEPTKEQIEARYRKYMIKVYGWLVDFEPYLKKELPLRKKIGVTYRWGKRHRVLRIFEQHNTFRSYGLILKIHQSGLVELRKRSHIELATEVCRIIETYVSEYPDRVKEKETGIARF